MDNYQGQGFMFPSEFQSVASSIQAWPLSAVNPMNPVPDTSFFASSHPSNSIYGDLYSPRDSCSGLQFSDCGGAIGGRQSPTEPLGFGGLYNMAAATSSSPFGSLHAEIISKVTAQDIMDAKALAASKSHSEAERRRRERINTHLAKLRSLLPSATKTDKASLLAEVIQHVKELKRQTSEMSEENYPLPTEADELTLDTANENGNFIVKASLCFEDRSDLIPDLIKALKALKLRTLKAEIATLGGRVKNILIVTGEDNDDSDHHQHQQSIVSSIQDALRAVVERTATADMSSQSAGGGIKRQRTNSLSTIIQETSF